MSFEKFLRLIRQDDTLTATAVVADDLDISYTLATSLVEDYCKGRKSRLERLYKTQGQKPAAEPEDTNPFDEIWRLEDEREYDRALALLEKRTSSGKIDRDSFDYHFFKGRILVKKEGTMEEVPDEYENMVDNEFNKAVDFCDDDDWEMKSRYCYYWQGYHYAYLGQPYNARNFFIMSMASDSEAIREDSREQVIEQEKELSDIWESYTTTYEYRDRKFLMPIKDSEIAGCIATGIDVFRLSNIPGCIKFPAGHPLANELYVGHPLNPEVYVPFSESEDLFFRDRVDELIYLLHCLGAEAIAVDTVSGKDFSRRIKCDPIKYPFVPEGLRWYGEESGWKRMVDGRLNGNRLAYSLTLSSSDTRFVTAMERQNILSSAQSLWKIVGGESAVTQGMAPFREQTATELRIEVQFRSLKDFQKESTPASPSSSPSPGSAEQEYLSELKFALEAGEITPRERRFLDKIRMQLGISVERAAQLENSLHRKRLFISYSRDDKDKVMGLLQRIERETGESCWMDLTGIESGSQFEEVIINAIDGADIVLFMMSDKAVASPWTKREVYYAEEEGKRIVPISIDGKGLRGWVKFHFGHVDCIDSFSEDQIAKLIGDLKSWLG